VITHADDFFTLGCGRCSRVATADCSTRPWVDGLLALRRICLDVGLAEVVKWGDPCYLHAGRNIAILGALRGDFRLTFFNAALMKDPAGVLERQGAQTRYPDMVRFTDNAQVPALTPTLRAYLQEAMGYAEAGIKPPREPAAIELPPELADALAADAELAAAFHRLTPGRQRSYAVNLNGAKKSVTRVARIAAYRERILAGKGALER